MECPKEIAKARVLHRKVVNRIDDENTFERRFAEFCLNYPEIVHRFESEQKLVKACRISSARYGTNKDQVDTRYEESKSFSNVLAALKRSKISLTEALGDA